MTYLVSPGTVKIIFLAESRLTYRNNNNYNNNNNNNNDYNDDNNEIKI